MPPLGNGFQSWRLSSHSVAPEDTAGFSNAFTIGFGTEIGLAFMHPVPMTQTPPPPPPPTAGPIPMKPGEGIQSSRLTRLAVDYTTLLGIDANTAHHPPPSCRCKTAFLISYITNASTLIPSMHDDYRDRRSHACAEYPQPGEELACRLAFDQQAKRLAFSPGRPVKVPLNFSIAPEILSPMLGLR